MIEYEEYERKDIYMSLLDLCEDRDCDWYNGHTNHIVAMCMLGNEEIGSSRTMWIGEPGRMRTNINPRILCVAMKMILMPSER